MEIPGFLQKNIENKRVVLLLGAGASMEGADATGDHPPSANSLRDLIADEFLDGTFKDSSLGMVSEYAISESDTVTVQQFISSTLVRFEPKEAHNALPKFVFRSYAASAIRYSKGLSN